MCLLVCSSVACSWWYTTGITAQAWPNSVQICSQYRKLLVCTTSLYEPLLLPYMATRWILACTAPLHDTPTLHNPWLQ